MMRYLITSFLLLLSITLTAQVNLDKEKLDAYFDALEANDKTFMSISISHNGELIYENTIGYASISDQRKIDANTQFRIGSISKVFTTVLAFQLIEEGKLTLDTKLSKYFPKVKNADKITISHLMSHRSGIYNLTNSPDYQTYDTQFQSKADMISRIEALDSDFEPGTRASYSNSAFMLLGYIIEDISGKAYDEVLQEKIAKILGLTRTKYGGKIDLNNNQAYSYSYGQLWSKFKETDMSIPGGAGALVSTPREINKFMEGLFNGKLISEKSISSMKEIVDRHGRGLFQIPFNNKIAYGHNGGIDGFLSSTGYFENENLAISFTSNGMNYNMNNILIAALSCTFGTPFEIPEFKPVYGISPEDLKTYEGLYSSAQIPLKITIKVQNGRLTGQATGQGAFPLTPISATEFRFDTAGIVIVFGEKEGDAYNTFTLKQGGGQYDYTKEKN